MLFVDFFLNGLYHRLYIDDIINEYRCGRGIFCVCWLVGECATSMELFVDSSIEYLLYVVTQLIDCSFWLAFAFVLTVSSLHFLMFFVSIVWRHILLFFHGGGSAVQLWFCSREPSRDSWAIIEVVNSSWITSREAMRLWLGYLYPRSVKIFH